jgi:hypothetical protein
MLALLSLSITVKRVKLEGINFPIKSGHFFYTYAKVTNISLLQTPCAGRKLSKRMRTVTRDECFVFVFAKLRGCH